VDVEHAGESLPAEVAVKVVTYKVGRALVEDPTSPDGYRVLIGEEFDRDPDCQRIEAAMQLAFARSLEPVK
jgi:hypothetical protein